MSTEEVSNLKQETERLHLERDQLYRERSKLFGIKPTVYIRNLDPNTDEAEITSWFVASGPVKEVRLQRDPNGVSQCSAFVEFYYIASCDEACGRFHEKFVDKNSSQPLLVQPERKFNQAVTAYRSGKFVVQSPLNQPVFSAAPPSNPSHHHNSKGGNGHHSSNNHSHHRNNNNNNATNTTSNHHSQPPPPPQQPHFFAPDPMQSPFYAHTPQYFNTAPQPMPPPPQQQPQIPDSSIYIGHLRPDLTVEALRRALDAFGGIIEATIVDNKGFGFVTFENTPSAKRCIEALNGEQSSLAKRGSTLVVQYKGRR